MILRLNVLTEHRLVTVGQTDKRTAGLTGHVDIIGP